MNSYKNQNFKVDYAIVAAMNEELDYLLERFSTHTFIEIQIGELSFKIYDYKNHKVLISATGIGTAFSACILTLIHSHFSPEYFFVCGTAGGIRSDLKLRDVIIADKAFEAEIQDIFSMLENTPFEGCLKNPLKDEYFPAHYSADKELLNICNSLLIQNIKIYTGTVVSSNAFPAPKELFEKIKKVNPYCIDMETSSFYQTAWVLNTKVLAIRGISNLLNTDGTDEKICESDVKGSSEAASNVLLALLDKVIELKNPHHIDPNEIEAFQLINEHNLTAHPEGGYFAPVYKSKDLVKLTNGNKYDDETRSASTSIYYLLNKTDYSAWHVLKSDELWYFHKGSPLNIYVIDMNGYLSTYVLGDPLKFSGGSFQVSIKAGCYFSAENIDKLSYCLVGCMVAPGFEYNDFQLADKNQLLAMYPQHEALIKKLSR